VTLPSQTEFAEVAALVRAHLEVEDELGGAGIPRTIRGAVDIVASVARSPGPAAPAEPTDDRMQDTSSGTIERLAPEEKRRRLGVLAQEATSCTRCVLHERRNRVVFARGSADAEVAFVGEGPGADEDEQGLPFVGRAGQLLDRMIAAMGYGREDVYVCNVVKCRPPDNRTPRPEEAIACSRYLVPQLQAVAPKLIVALGRCAAENLGVAQATGPWRGRWGTWQGITVMPTYHPAFLLRSPEYKRTVWEDLQKVMGRLGRAPVRPHP
jgi:DNA polymerase